MRGIQHNDYIFLGFIVHIFVGLVKRSVLTHAMDLYIQSMPWTYIYRSMPWTCIYKSMPWTYIYMSMLMPCLVMELCESRGGRPGLSVLTNLMVSVNVKLYIEPCSRIGLSLSLICQPTSEDIKHHLKKNALSMRYGAIETTGVIVSAVFPPP